MAPQSGYSSTETRLNWVLYMLVFVEEGKPENMEKKPWEQGREPTTKSTHKSVEPGRHGWEASVPAPQQADRKRFFC